MADDDKDTFPTDDDSVDDTSKKKKSKEKDDVTVNNRINMNPTLEEQASKTAVFSWGRMNPPTQGHEKLVNRLVDVARQRGGEPVLFLTHSQDPIRNPLSYDEKLMLATKAFGNLVRSTPSRNFQQLMKELDKKYDSIIMVVGQDRLKEFETLLNKYNGKDYNFESIEVVSAGDRDPDAEDVKGMSATKMRQAAAKGDLKSFTSGLPARLQSMGAKVFDLVRLGMRITEETDTTVIAQLEEDASHILDTMIIEENRDSIVESIRKGIAAKIGKKYDRLSQAQKTLIEQRIEKRTAEIDTLIQEATVTDTFTDSKKRTFKVGDTVMAPLGMTKIKKAAKIVGIIGGDYGTATLKVQFMKSGNKQNVGSDNVDLHEAATGPITNTHLVAKALDAMHRLIKSKKDKSSLTKYAYDILRTFDLDDRINTRELAKLYMKKYGMNENVIYDVQEEGGAGEQGTDELVKNYLNDTPGQEDAEMDKIHADVNEAFEARFGLNEGFVMQDKNLSNDIEKALKDTFGVDVMGWGYALNHLTGRPANEEISVTGRDNKSYIYNYKTKKITKDSVNESKQLQEADDEKNRVEKIHSGPVKYLNKIASELSKLGYKRTKTKKWADGKETWVFVSEAVIPNATVAQKVRDKLVWNPNTITDTNDIKDGLTYKISDEHNNFFTILGSKLKAKLKAGEFTKSKSLIIVKEATSPMSKINKLLDKKKAKEVRSADLAKNPEKTKYVTDLPKKKLDEEFEAILEEAGAPTKRFHQLRCKDGTTIKLDGRFRAFKKNTARAADSEDSTEVMGQVCDGVNDVKEALSRVDTVKQRQEKEKADLERRQLADITRAEKQDSDAEAREKEREMDEKRREADRARAEKQRAATAASMNEAFAARFNNLDEAGVNMSKYPDTVISTDLYKGYKKFWDARDKKKEDDKKKDDKKKPVKEETQLHELNSNEIEKKLKQARKDLKDAEYNEKPLDVAKARQQIKHLEKSLNLAKFTKEEDEKLLNLIENIFTSVERDEEKNRQAIVEKAEASGIDIAILNEVYSRGLKEWEDRRIEGKTPQQWGMARLNSFITGGKARQLDADLME